MGDEREGQVKENKEIKQYENRGNENRIRTIRAQQGGFSSSKSTRKELTFCCDNSIFLIFFSCSLDEGILFTFVTRTDRVIIKCPT